MKTSVNVDFKNEIGVIKPLHAVGGGARQGGSFLSKDFTKEFSEMGVPYARLHDIEAPYGSNQFIDFHCVFPDFNADENDPKSYNFIPTDNYLNAIIQTGCKPFYRLGESIDHFEKKLYIDPPKDYAKWARICEHIIMHYNYGWADGYHMDLEYWEIWNEPESKAMWLGTWEEFCEFYSVVANYLKKCFPNLKIGGYSATGFYSVFREKMDAGWFKIAVPYCKQFLEYVTAETTKAPLDFFSWHCYALNPKELENFAYYARETLDSYGLTKTESFLTEYNMFECFTRRPSVTETHASEIVAGIVLGQNAPVDSIMYYDVRTSIYNGIFALKEDCINVKRYQLFYGFKWFNELYKLKGQCFAKSENEKVYVLSATDEKQKKVLVSVTDFDGDLSFNFDECKGNKIVVRCSTFRKSTPTRKIYDFTKNFVLTVKKNNLYLIEIK